VGVVVRVEDFAVPREAYPFHAEVLEAVGGLAQPLNLALVAAAAACLEPGESYVEVGSFKGASLIAASRAWDGDVVAIDDFSMGEGSRELLERNLEQFGGHAEILEGDAFELLRGGALAGRRVGVYYYDAAHDYESQVEGLRLIEPYLAERALLIVDDSDWERVERAIADYVAAQPRVRELVRIEGKERGHPEWWEGVTILAWS
jgi:predicted O-methyltransferase YrrM